MHPANEVDRAMKTIGVKTLREFAHMCRVSEKTMIGWRNNKITPLGKAIIEVHLENHALKVKLEKSNILRTALRELLNE